MKPIKKKDYELLAEIQENNREILEYEDILTRIPRIHLD